MTTIPSIESHVLIDVKKLSALLDMGVSSVWRHVKHGRIPAPIHVGRSTRWRLAEVLSFIEKAGKGVGA